MMLPAQSPPVTPPRCDCARRVAAIDPAELASESRDFGRGVSHTLRVVLAVLHREGA